MLPVKAIHFYIPPSIDLWWEIFNISLLPNLIYYMWLSGEPISTHSHERHFQAIKWILCYIKSTIYHGLSFLHIHSRIILGYPDVDGGHCIKTQRSTYGYSIFLGGNLISWSAKKQPTVSCSSCMFEYRMLENIASKIVWITHFLRELHILPFSRSTLLCGNRSAPYLSQNSVSHK